MVSLRLASTYRSDQATRDDDVAACNLEPRGRSHIDVARYLAERSAVPGGHSDFDRARVSTPIESRPNDLSMAVTEQVSGGDERDVVARVLSQYDAMAIFGLRDDEERALGPPFRCVRAVMLPFQITIDIARDHQLGSSVRVEVGLYSRQVRHR